MRRCYRRRGRLARDGRLEDAVTDLPGLGDHQTNYPVVGPDDKLYWVQGTVTNQGVVGADNFAYEWLSKYPRDHDIPAHDVTLAGRNYEFRNVLGSLTETVRAGAFVPFGTEASAGQVAEECHWCSGSLGSRRSATGTRRGNDDRRPTPPTYPTTS